MPDWALFLLILIAIAIGFFLGKQSRKTPKKTYGPIVDEDYVKGPNYLLNEQPDSTIEAFISALEVSADTLQTHLALGNFLRRKGEASRAIRIHQNLLAHPSLTIEQSHEAQYELAIDFLKAGLFDRAERLLKELSVNDEHYRIRALHHLLEIYRDEREWRSGLDILSQLSGSRFNKQYEKWAPIKAHFCCELAEESMAGSGVGSSNYLVSRKWLKKALSHDKESVRASLSLGKLEIDAGYYKQGMHQLQKVCHQHPDYLGEALTYLLIGYKRLNNIAGYHEFLLAINSQYCNDTLSIAIADFVKEKKGHLAATEFIAQYLEKNSSVIVLDKFLHLYIECTEGDTRHYLQLIRTAIKETVENAAKHACEHCGFKGRQIHWLCPSCKEWKGAPCKKLQD